MDDLRLIVGLGNPGPRYAHNRHNVGFRLVDELAQAHGLTGPRTEHRAQTLHGLIGERRVILAKPQTWMNESGQAVGPLARFYKVPPERMLVVFDDLDMPLGVVRFRPDGSSGGHRGMQSIIQLLGTQAFPRLKVGIGRPPGKMDPADYVLQDFSQDEEPVLWDALRAARQMAEAWLGGDEAALRTAMTQTVKRET